MKRPSTSTIIACTALFFSLTGAGMAASGYRITSLWQISPNVRHALRGHRGPAGPSGAAALDRIRVFTHYTEVDPATSPQMIGSASCPNGMRVLNGGYQAGPRSIEVTQSFPRTMNEWDVIARATDTTMPEAYIDTWVECVPVG